MADLKEGIIDSIKGFLLPELVKLHEGIDELRFGQAAIEKRLDAIEKQLMIMNQNIFDNTRRIDDTSKRIDYVPVEIGNVRKEKTERLKRSDAVTADILHRMAIIEEMVLLGR